MVKRKILMLTLAGALTLGATGAGLALASVPPTGSAVATAQARDAAAQGESSIRGSLPLSTLTAITPSQAGQAAVDAVPGSTVRKIKLEGHRGYLVYKVKLTTSQGHRKAFVDAGSGRVLAVVTPTGKDGATPSFTGSLSLSALARITPTQAGRAALGAFPGATVVQTRLHTADGALVYQVKLRTVAGKTAHAWIDAGSGRVLRTKTAHPESVEAPEHSAAHPHPDR